MLRSIRNEEKITLPMELIWFIVTLMLEMSQSIVYSRTFSTNDPLMFTRDRMLQENHATKSIRSEDGDIIDCIDIYKQPAFDHPVLKGHKIQLNPSHIPQMESDKTNGGREVDSIATITKQVWRRSGSCPKGTVPIRRATQRNGTSSNNNYASKQPMSFQFGKNFNESKELYLLYQNRSVAILHSEGFAYFGAKGDIKVFNPRVESDDEYSTSRIALKNGPSDNYQAVESGWTVNPKVYGDRQTRLYVYWTLDGSRQTGCFDLTCPGFVQTSNEIALGAAIYPISNPTGLPALLTIYIHKDLRTSNWWVQYGEETNIGYWPADLMDMLKHNAETIQWGGEVYSPKVGRVKPHTATAMGSGQFADFVFQSSGSIFRMRELRGNGALMRPRWVNSYSDEYNCYNAYYIHDYVEDPEFYFGGPGRNPNCP